MGSAYLSQPGRARNGTLAQACVVFITANSCTCAGRKDDMARTDDAEDYVVSS